MTTSMVMEHPFPRHLCTHGTLESLYVVYRNLNRPHVPYYDVSTCFPSIKRLWYVALSPQSIFQTQPQHS